MSKKGFTLIELLVTISIIAVLAAIGLVVFSTALKQGRDAKRQSDLRAIQSAMEQYFADQFVYPASITFGSALSQEGKTYLNVIPTDPIVSSYPQYTYQALSASLLACDNLAVTTKCTSYCLYAKLENSSLPVPTGCTYPPGYNFAVTPP